MGKEAKAGPPCGVGGRAGATDQVGSMSRMDSATLAGMCAVVVAGACLHRVAGLGLGMVVAPVLTLMMGPVAGVTVSNGAAIVTSLLVLAAMRADVDWRHFARLVPLIVAGSLLGAIAVRRVDTAWLDVLVGASVLLAIATTLMLRRHRAGIDGPVKGVSVGLAAGFMNTTCGVAAPALTAYALATGWEHRRFAATLQPVLITANLTSLLTKALVGAVPAPGVLPWWIWPVAAAGVCLGVALGSALARVVSTRVAAGITVTVSSAGAAAALVRGLLSV
jgi:uncharacterized membrane protein YfcA